MSTYLFSDLAGHLFSKVPVLTDSVEQLATFHHLHNNQESRSVEKTRKERSVIRRKWQKRRNGLMYCWDGYILKRLHRELFTLGWTRVGTGHCWRKPPGFGQCLGGWHTSYVNAPAWGEPNTMCKQKYSAEFSYSKLLYSKSWIILIVSWHQHILHSLQSNATSMQSYTLHRMCSGRVFYAVQTCFLGVPLRTRHRIQGVVCVQLNKLHKTDEQDMKSASGHVLYMLL